MEGNYEHTKLQLTHITGATPLGWATDYIYPELFSHHTDFL